MVGIRRITATLKPGLERPAQFKRQRDAVPVLLLAQGDADPAFGDAIFLDVAALDALEADAVAALEQRLVEIGAVGVGRAAIGGGVGAHARVLSRARADKATARKGLSSPAPPSRSGQRHAVRRSRCAAPLPAVARCGLASANPLRPRQ